MYDDFVLFSIYRKISFQIIAFIDGTDISAHLSIDVNVIFFRSLIQRHHFEYTDNPNSNISSFIANPFAIDSFSNRLPNRVQ